MSTRSLRSRRLLVTVAVAVSLVLAGCVSVPSNANSGRDTTPDAAWTSSQASGGCVANASENAGWLFWIADGDHYAVSFNATFANATAVNATLDHDRTGVYTLTLTPTAGETKPGTPPDCTTAARFGASASLPTDFTAFRVVYDGRTIAVARNDGTTTGHLLDLPTPINRTARS